MLERREQKVQVARLGLRALPLAEPGGHRLLAVRDQRSLPFAVAAVKQQHRIAVGKPQHIAQVIDLAAT